MCSHVLIGFPSQVICISARTALSLRTSVSTKSPEQPSTLLTATYWVTANNQCKDTWKYYYFQLGHFSFWDAFIIYLKLNSLPQFFLCKTVFCYFRHWNWFAHYQIFSKDWVLFIHKGDYVTKPCFTLPHKIICCDLNRWFKSRNT